MTTDNTGRAPCRIGSMFSGVGALCELVTAPVLGGRVVWHADDDPAAAAVLDRHWPDTPNLGDVSRVDWTTVPPVAVLTSGFPCVDLSSAGRRAGLAPHTRSGLWQHTATAVDVLRPDLVVIENVEGLLSARADGPVESCPLCLGDRRQPALRALGAVLGDLADLGYDARWFGLRASDVGSPHRRFRLVILAWPAASHPQGPRWEGTRPQPPRRGPDRSVVPAAAPGRWGVLTAGFRHWERILGRPAPDPLVPGPRSKWARSTAFTEWMMGLPRGHVDDLALSRNAKFRLLGNALVPLQGIAGLTELLNPTRWREGDDMSVRITS